ncbi:MAG: UDP-3-O-(3-hydroxymyristoyl)glucosamine N-acyltransferase [Phycisphaerae bacterium]|nr:UDP-3-O-(3-hydroxymyristoyl)glucosamine N-acyltransferase [Phycisphaerae bacterium]
MLLADVATKLQANLIGDGQKDITGVNTIQDASASEVCFLASEKHAKKLLESSAAAVLTDKPIADCAAAQLVVANVNAALITLLEFFAPKLTLQRGVHSTAVVEPTAELDRTVSVGPGAYVGHAVKVGADTVIGPGCSVGENTTIGSCCRLDSNVVIYHDCRIGNSCIIQSNSTIGATGFGYSFIDGQHRLIPHNGGVILEDGVEIGANSCVDRAKFGDTIIGAGTKIDNLVQVAHNVKIGKLCLMAGQAGIGGSAVVGNGVVFAGRAGVVDNKSVGDGAILALGSIATEDVPPGETVLGMPPQNIKRELKCVAVYQRLPEMAKQFKELSKKVEKLEAAKDNKN